MADLKIKKIKIGENTYDIVDASVPGQISTAITELDVPGKITTAINNLDVANAGNVSAPTNNVVTLKNVNETNGLVGVTTTNSAEVYNKAGTDDLIQGAKDYADGLISGLGTILKFKGTVASETALKAIQGAKKGDVYIVTADSSEWVATADASSSTATTTWEKFGTTDVNGALYKDSNVFTDGYILKADGTDGKVKAVIADKTAVGLGNVTNDKQVKGLASGTTNGHIVTWSTDGYTVADSGKTPAGLVQEANTYTAGYTYDKETIDDKDAATLQAAKDYHDGHGYTHPVGGAPSKTSGFYKFSTDATSHVASVTAVTKADITGLGIPGENTAHSHTNGVGLIRTGNGGTSGTVDYKVALASETLDANAAVSRPTTDETRIYPVIPDKNGKLAIIVPWTDGSDDAKQYADAQDALQYAVSNGAHTHSAGTLTGSCTPNITATPSYLTAALSAAPSVTLSGNTGLVKGVQLDTKNLVTGSIAVGGMVNNVTTTNASVIGFTTNYTSSDCCLELIPCNTEVVGSVSASKNTSAITYATGAVDVNGSGAAVGTGVTPDTTGAVTVSSVSKPGVTLSTSTSSTAGAIKYVPEAKGASTAVTISGSVASDGAHEHTISKHSA